jgi:hypothetical protein
MPSNDRCFLRKHASLGLLLATSLLVASLFVCSTRDATAGDYTLTYAIDADGKNDAGKVETCGYEHTCEIESANSGLSLSLFFLWPDHKSVELRVNGPPGCCYSADANRIFYLEITPTLLRVPIYQGRPRRVNEFVLNERLGYVYLQFSNMR